MFACGSAGLGMGTRGSPRFGGNAPGWWRIRFLRCGRFLEVVSFRGSLAKRSAGFCRSLQGCFGSLGGGGGGVVLELPLPPVVNCTSPRFMR